MVQLLQMQLQKLIEKWRIRQTDKTANPTGTERAGWHDAEYSDCLLFEIIGTANIPDNCKLGPNAIGCLPEKTRFLSRIISIQVLASNDNTAFAWRDFRFCYSIGDQGQTVVVS